MPYSLSLCTCRSTILQQQFNRVGRVEHGSVALPGVIRSGSIGTESLSMGTMPSAQQQITMGQMHRGHMPPLVRTAKWLSVWCLRVFHSDISDTSSSSTLSFFHSSWGSSCMCRVQHSRLWWEPSTPVCKLCRRPRLTLGRSTTCHHWDRTWYSAVCTQIT